LRETFGQWFENMREKNVSSMLKVFEIENRLTIRIMRLMKQSHIASMDFVKILQLVEESITKNLLNRGSLGKFIFRDSQDRWFYIYKKGEKMKIGYLRHGFWDHFSEVFPEGNALYEAQDIFHAGNTLRYSSIVENLFVSTKRISHGVQNSEFGQFDRNENVWNAYMIPFETENSKQLRTSILKSSSQNSEGAKIQNLMKLLVNQGVFLTVNFESKSSIFRPRNKSASPTRTVSGRAMSTLLPDIEKELHTTESPQKDSKGRSQSFVMKGRRMTRLDTKMLQGGPKTMDNIEEIIGGPQVEENLPRSEYVEFLRDMRDIMNSHKEYFLSKINMFYLSHPKNRKVLN
jgi:hypothetical protein